jgi:WD40 repeat protein
MARNRNSLDDVQLHRNGYNANPEIGFLHRANIVDTSPREASQRKIPWASICWWSFHGLFIVLIAGNFWFLRNLPPPWAGPAVPQGAKLAAPVKKRVFDESLPVGAIARFGTVRMRDESVWTMRFTPDGTSLQTASSAGVRRWDLASGRWTAEEWNFQLGTLCGRQSRGASSDHLGLLTVRDIDGQRVISHCQCPVVADDHGINPTVALSDDGTLLASVTDAGDVQLWEVDTGRQKQSWKCTPSHGWMHAAVSPGGKAVAVVMSQRGDQPEKVVYCWDAVTGGLRFTLPNPDDHYYGFDSVAFVNDDVVATAYQGQHLFWWDAATGALLQHDDLAEEYRGNSFTRVDLLAVPDAKLLVHGGLGGTVRIWDVATRQVKYRFQAHGQILHVALSPDQKTLAAMTGRDGAIRLWDIKTGQELQSSVGHAAAVNAVSFSGTGKQLVSGGEDHTVRMWDIASGQQLKCLHHQHGSTHSVAFDGATVLAGTGNAYIRYQSLLFDYWPKQTDLYHSRFVYLPRKRLLARLGNEITVESLDDATTIATFPNPSEHGEPAIALSADGAWLGVGTTVWHVPSRARAFALRFEPLRKPAYEQEKIDSITGLGFSPGGQFLASGGLDGALRIWEVASGQELFCTSEQGASITTVRFSLDGRWLAVVRGNQILLVDPVTGQIAHRFPELDQPIKDLAFSPDGAHLASGNADTTVLLWDVRRAAASYRRPTVRLTQPELNELWESLKTERGTVPHQALVRLAGDPVSARPFLLNQLKQQHDWERTGLDEAPRWLADLAKKDPDVRDRAYRELEQLGKQIVPALRTALSKRPDADTAFRLERLLREHRDEKLDADHLRLVRALDVLEWTADPEFRRSLSDLGNRHPATWTSREAAAVAERLLEQVADQ